MKTIRVLLVIVLTAAALIMILSPSLLSGILPAQVVSAARMDEFPLLDTCTRIARPLIASLRGREAPSIDIVTGALGESFWDELSALLMVAALTIPVSLLLGMIVYKPLYKGALTKGLLYLSLNLVSMLVAWILYRQVYFRFVVEGLLAVKIDDQTVLTVVNALVQLASAAAVGMITLWIVLAVLATRIVIGKIIMPLIGTLLRTLLFAFLVSLFLITQSDLTVWTITLPLLGVTLLLCGISDWVFGC